MRKGWLAETLSAWLPDAARLEWYRPALDDLYAEHVERGRLGLTYSARVVLLWLERLRLTATERVLHLFAGHPPGPLPPRKEFIHMVLGDLRHALRSSGASPRLRRRRS